MRKGRIATNTTGIGQGEGGGEAAHQPPSHTHKLDQSGEESRMEKTEWGGGKRETGGRGEKGGKGGGGAHQPPSHTCKLDQSGEGHAFAATPGAQQIRLPAAVRLEQVVQIVHALPVQQHIIFVELQLFLHNPAGCLNSSRKPTYMENPTDALTLHGLPPPTQK